jgi:hypothetical protein
LKMGSIGFLVVVGQGVIWQLATGPSRRFRCGNERSVFRTRRESGVSAMSTMGGVARPRKGSQVIRHTGAGGIEFDEAVALQDVTFAVDQARPAAAFP